jgi:hypothetical protein
MFSVSDIVVNGRQAVEALPTNREGAKPMKSQPRYRPGAKIGGRYQIHKVLMGGMGEVYLCLDLETIQAHALKTF